MRHLSLLKSSLAQTYRYREVFQREDINRCTGEGVFQEASLLTLEKPGIYCYCFQISKLVTIVFQMNTLHQLPCYIFLRDKGSSLILLLVCC